MDILVLVALMVGLIAIIGILAFQALRAIGKWLAKHWLGVATIITSLLALVFADWEEFRGVIAIGAVVATIRWLLKEKDPGK